MRIFGNYLAFRHLASGGMAELYLACHTGASNVSDRRLYVVKQLAPHLADNKACVNMFLDETRLAKQLFHPNIVRVHDSGRTASHPYFTMEHLNGRDLVAVRRRLAACRTAMPINAAIAIILQICRALAYAHELRDSRGSPLRIVHRDISPGNVLITVDGVAKLIDFGVAHAQHRIEETRVGVVKGKLRYMSPEQALAARVDHRSDIFSLSALLWELTVGRTLFDQIGDLEILRAIVDANAPRPSTLHPEFPPALEEIICKGLRRNADERYQSAVDMATALADYAARTGLDTSNAALAETLGRLFDCYITEEPATATDTNDDDVTFPDIEIAKEVPETASDISYDDVGFPDIEIADELTELSAPHPSERVFRMLICISCLVGLAVTAAVLI